MGYELSLKIYHWYEAVDNEDVQQAWNVMSEGEGSLTSSSLKQKIGDKEWKNNISASPALRAGVKDVAVKILKQFILLLLITCFLLL